MGYFMKKHNRKIQPQSRHEIAKLADIRDEQLQELPLGVVEALRRARDHFSRIAVSITDVAYECEGNRAGVSVDCSFHASEIDRLLDEFQYSTEKMCLSDG
jgi:hypothetical protein